MVRAVTIAPTANTAPTDKSSPPATSTIVSPIATIAIVDMPCSTLKMFLDVAKYGLANDMKTHRMISAMKTPNSLDCPICRKKLGDLCSLAPALPTAGAAAASVGFGSEFAAIEHSLQISPPGSLLARPAAHHLRYSHPTGWQLAL